MHQRRIEQPLAEQVEDAVDLGPRGGGQGAGLGAGLVGAGQRRRGGRLVGHFGRVSRAPWVAQ